MISVCVCVCVCVCVYVCARARARLERSEASLEAGVTDSCELSDVDAGKLNFLCTILTAEPSSLQPFYTLLNEKKNFKKQQ